MKPSHFIISLICLAGTYLACQDPQSSGTWNHVDGVVTLKCDIKVIQTGDVSAQLLSGTMVQPDIPDYTGVWSAVKLRY